MSIDLIAVIAISISTFCTLADNKSRLQIAFVEMMSVVKIRYQPFLS